MKFIVGKHKIELKKEDINEKEINVTNCEFEFDEDITDDFVKEAYFTLNENSYKQIISNNECSIPSEVLEEKGIVKIGVVAYKVENEEEIIRYNPTPVLITTLEGSLVDAENSEPITPSEMEQYEQILQDGLDQLECINIVGEETETGVEITITDRDGEPTIVNLYNGRDGQDGQDGQDGERGPIGPTGPTGPSNTLSIGTVEKGVNASATITGTSPNQTLNLVLPQGDTGLTGPTGPAGRDGVDGRDGQDGQDGYTPVRGVDYWTASDIQAIQSYCDSLVLGALGTSY